MGRFPTQSCRYCGRSFFSACTCSGASFSSNGQAHHIARLQARADQLPPEAARIVREVAIRAQTFLEFGR